MSYDGWLERPYEEAAARNERMQRAVEDYQNSIIDSLRAMNVSEVEQWAADWFAEPLESTVLKLYAQHRGDKAALGDAVYRLINNTVYDIAERRALDAEP